MLFQMLKFIFKNNLLYFSGIALLALTGGSYLFFYEKPQLIYFFSENRHNLLDTFFIWTTKLGEEWAYIFTALVFSFKKIRLGLLILLTGLMVMGTSYALKAFFAIDRPITFLQKHQLFNEINLVPGIDPYSGPTSFPSGHSMAAFALSGLVVFLLPSRKRYVIPLLLMAIGVAVSRIYLVHHFYVDVYAGALIGVAIAMGAYLGWQRLSN